MSIPRKLSRQFILALFVLICSSLFCAAQTPDCPVINSFTAAPIAPGPVAFWRLDEATGAIRKDLAGASDLLDYNLVTQVPGKIGAGANMVTALGQRLAAPDNPNLRFAGGNFTVTFWVKFTVIKTALILAKDNTFGNASQREFQLYLSNGRIGAGLYDDSPMPQFMGSVTANNFGQVSPGLWYFVVFR